MLLFPLCELKIRGTQGRFWGTWNVVSLPQFGTRRSILDKNLHCSHTRLVTLFVLLTIILRLALGILWWSFKLISWAVFESHRWMAVDFAAQMAAHAADLAYNILKLVTQLIRYVMNNKQYFPVPSELSQSTHLGNIWQRPINRMIHVKTGKQSKGIVLWSWMLANDGSSADHDPNQGNPEIHGMVCYGMPWHAVAYNRMACHSRPWHAMTCCGLGRVTIANSGPFSHMGTQQILNLRPARNNDKTIIFLINITILEPDGPGLTNGPHGFRAKTKRSSNGQYKLQMDAGWLAAGRLAGC